MTDTPISTCAELENLDASTHPVRGMIAKIEANRAKSQAMAQSTELTTKTVTDTRRPTLPRWSDSVRGAPNTILRSCLFGVIAKGDRRYLEQESIYAPKNITMRYTGPQLDQGDLDVWLAVLHLTRTQPIGQECNITSYELLQLLRLTDTGGNRKTLKSRLSRLNTCALDAQAGPLIHYEGSLINEIFCDEQSHLIIRLSPSLRKMFAKDQYTQIHWGVRQALNGHFLAQWLHGFYSSHAAPFPLRVETLHKMSGSKTTNMSKFRQLLHKALSALSRASLDHRQPFRYCIEGNLVKIEKNRVKRNSVT